MCQEFDLGSIPTPGLADHTLYVGDVEEMAGLWADYLRRLLLPSRSGASGVDDVDVEYLDMLRYCILTLTCNTPYLGLQVWQLPCGVRGGFHGGRSLVGNFGRVRRTP